LLLSMIGLGVLVQMIGLVRAAASTFFTSVAS